MSQTSASTAVVSQESRSMPAQVGEAIFSSKTSWILASTSAFLVLLAVIMALYGAKPYDTSATPSHSYSRHVLGHRMWVDFLQQSQVKVLRVHSPRHLSSVSSPLFLIEPLVHLSFQSEPGTVSRVLQHRLRAGLHSVVVLPKWRAASNAMQPGYRREMVSVVQKSLITTLPPLLPPLSVQQQPVDYDHSTKKPRWTEQTALWQPHNLPMFRRHPNITSTSAQTPHPRTLSVPAIPAVATKTNPQSIVSLRLSVLGPQTVRVTGASWHVILGTSEHAWMVGYLSPQGGLLVMVSDPDLFHNFNLQRGDNAAVAWGLVRDVLNTDTVLIDEVFHNQVKQFSLTEELGRFPRSLLVFHALLLWALLVWAGATRFGKPVTLPQHRQHGPKEIIDITAWVLACGLQPSRLVAQYIYRVIDDLAERLGLGQVEPRRKAEQIDMLAERWEIRPEAIDLYQRALHLQEHRRSWLDAMRLARRAWSFRHQILSRKRGVL